MESSGWILHLGNGAHKTKLKQEGKQFLKMGQHFTKLQNRLVNYNYAIDFRNPAKIRKVAKFRKVAKILQPCEFSRVAKIPAFETRLLDQPASKFFRFLQ